MGNSHVFVDAIFFCQERSINTVDGRNPAPVDIPNIYRVLYIPGGAGFLPSTVCHPVLLLDGQSFQSLSKRENFSVTGKLSHYKRRRGSLNLT